MIVSAPVSRGVLRERFGSIWRLKLVRSNVMVALTAVLVTAPAAMAQDKPKVIKPSDIPESAFPPVGMCRIWLADVAERQQPAPTDCATAIRTMPRDATVLFGDLKRGAKLLPGGNAAAQRAGLSAGEEARARARGLTSLQNEARVGQQMRGNMTPTQAAAAAAAASARTAPGAGVTAVKAPETKAAVVKPPEPPPHH
jgi:hypothetical protein